MEPSQRRYNLRPLPGGRRGAPGAGAGCLSMRDTGDVALSRRALVTKDTTAGRHVLNRRTHDVEDTADLLSDDTRSLFSSIPSTRPSYMTRRTKTSSTVSTFDGVVQDVDIDSVLAPTANVSATRRRWTSEMNQFILRTYLQLTSLETDTKTYLEPLHLKFLEKFPNMQVSRQRIGDQRRAIIRSKLLPHNIIDRIYNEVKEEINTLHTNLQARQTCIKTQIFTASPLLNKTQVTNIDQTVNKKNPTSRMRWTTQQNEAIMRSYYRITNLETNKTAYRKLLHKEFITAFPSLAHLSEQRVADQRRTIVNNRYISTDRLNLIKEAVAVDLGQQPINKTPCNKDNEQNPYDDNNLELPLNDNKIEISLSEYCKSNTEIPSERKTEIDSTFHDALDFYKETEPVSRTYIPKQKSSKKLAEIVDYLNNIILPEHIKEDTDFETFQTIIYCAAWTAAKANGSKINLIPSEASQHIRKQYKPHWQRRLEKRLGDLRIKIGRLTQFINGNRNRKLTNHVNQIKEQYKIHSLHEEPNTNLTHVLDTLKQKLSVVTGRLQRYKNCTLRKQQNNIFSNNEKQFYRNIKQTTANIQQNCTENSKNTPDPDTLQRFWKDIWEKPEQHNTQAEWIEIETINNDRYTEMDFQHIPLDIFSKVLRNLHNWKAPGSDNIHSYWYKKFVYIHPYLYKHINNFINDPSKIPSYITAGTTFMISKDPNDSINPAKYRPITCLQTIYKIITSCISELVYKHIDTNNMLTEQQKGCRRSSQGCKEQLTIDSVILTQAQKTKGNLFSMYIDYKKAYDSVPHSWLLQVLEIYRIHPKLIRFLKTMMKNWTTRLRLSTPTTTMETDPIKIQRGIFQGDSLSPLWFCLALNPLSNILNSTSIGYSLKYHESKNDINNPPSTHKLNHLLYMDDIKLYAEDENQLYQLTTLTEQFSKDIKMEFGIDKCKINSIKSGRIYQHDYTLETGEKIDPLNEDETYKYLGYNQSRQIHHNEIKQMLTQQFRHRLNTILKTQLYAQNTIKAINTFAIPILTYSFGIINWTKSDLKKLQRTINTTMTKFRKHHPRSCIQRLTLPRKEGGRGLIDIINLHNTQIITMRQYFFNKMGSSVLHKAIAENDYNFTPLNLKINTAHKHEKLIDDKIKIADWSRKSLHGRHRNDLSQPNVDKEASNAWLSRGELFPETEGFITAIQDQVIETRNYKKYIMKIPNLPSDSCRKCNSSSETIQHITGACKTIAQTDYKFRHDQVANIIHQKIATKYKLIATPKTPIPYYKYIPETVLENTNYKLYFDRAILTDKTVHYNRPDITLVDKENKSAFIIDIAIPNTHNLQTTIAEKLTKYTDLKDEISRMWHLKNISIVPIVLSTTGIIPKQLANSLTLLDLPQQTYIQLQKAVILNTCRIVRKFLQIESIALPTFNIASNPNTTDTHLA